MCSRSLIRRLLSGISSITSSTKQPVTSFGHKKMNDKISGHLFSRTASFILCAAAVRLFFWIFHHHAWPKWNCQHLIASVASTVTQRLFSATIFVTDFFLPLNFLLVVHELAFSVRVTVHKMFSVIFVNTIPLLIRNRLTHTWSFHVNPPSVTQCGEGVFSYLSGKAGRVGISRLGYGSWRGKQHTLVIVVETVWSLFSNLARDSAVINWFAVLDFWVGCIVLSHPCINYYILS